MHGGRVPHTESVLRGEWQACEQEQQQQLQQKRKWICVPGLLFESRWISCKSNAFLGRQDPVSTPNSRRSSFCLAGTSAGQSSVGGPVFSSISHDSSVDLGGGGTLTHSNNNISGSSAHEFTSNILPKLRYTQPSPDGRRQLLPGQEEHQKQGDRGDVQVSSNDNLVAIPDGVTKKMLCLDSLRV